MNIVQSFKVQGVPLSHGIFLMGHQKFIKILVVVSSLNHVNHREEGQLPGELETTYKMVALSMHEKSFPTRSLTTIPKSLRMDGGCVHTYKSLANLFKRSSLLHWSHMAKVYFDFVMTWIPCYCCFLPFAKYFWHGRGALLKKNSKGSKRHL